jgi:folylpolyglutamate synthase/dihydropteroate synthase
LSDADLATHAARVGIAMTPSGTVPDAMQAAARVARAGDRVVVFGSFHTVGPALSCV